MRVTRHTRKWETADRSLPFHLCEPLHVVWASDPWLAANLDDGDRVGLWPMRGSVPATAWGPEGLVCGSRTPGGANNAATLKGVAVPNAAPLQITGDISVACLVDRTMSPHPPSSPVLVQKYETTGNQRSWQFFMPQHRIGVTTSIDGTNTVSSSGTPTAVPLQCWVKFERRRSDGRTRTYTAPYTTTEPDPADWTQWGADSTISAGSSLFNTPSDIRFGGGNATAKSTGLNLHRAIIYDGLQSQGTATKVLDVNFVRDRSLSFVEDGPYGYTVYNMAELQSSPQIGSGTPLWDASSAAYNGRPVVAFDGASSLSLTLALDTLPQPFTYLIVGNAVPDSTAQRFAGNGVGTGQGIGVNSSNLWTMSNGTGIFGGAADAGPHLFRGYANTTASTLSVDEVQVAVGDNGANTLARVGVGGGVIAPPNPTLNFLKGNVAYLALFRGDATKHPDWSMLKSFLGTYYGLLLA